MSSATRDYAEALVESAERRQRRQDRANGDAFRLGLIMGILPGIPLFVVVVWQFLASSGVCP